MTKFDTLRERLPEKYREVSADAEKGFCGLNFESCDPSGFVERIYVAAELIVTAILLPCPDEDVDWTVDAVEYLSAIEDDYSANMQLCESCSLNVLRAKQVVEMRARGDTSDQIRQVLNKYREKESALRSLTVKRLRYREDREILNNILKRS